MAVDTPRVESAPFTPPISVRRPGRSPRPRFAILRGRVAAITVAENAIEELPGS